MIKTSVEELSNQKYNRLVESYEARYSKQFEKLAKSESFKGSLSKNTMYTLGMQLDNYKRYESYVAENSSASSLGVLPKVALDLISATYALSVAPQLASVQTLEESQGLIYFKKVFTHGYPLTAQNGLPSLPEDRWMGADGKFEGEKTLNGAWKKWLDTRGRPATGADDKLEAETLTAKNFDAITFNALKGWQSSPTAYMSERQFLIVGEGENTIKYGVGNLRWNVPMNLRLVNKDGKVFDLLGSCEGPGRTPKFYGEVNVSVAASGADYIVTIPSGFQGGLTYDVDFEKAPDVPAIEFGTDSRMVSAEIIALKENLGTFKSFAFNKRFGKQATDEQLADLTGHMAMAESEKIIAAYVRCANNYAPITWNLNKPTGISEFEHRQSFLYAIQAASAAIGARAGRGFANKLVAGYVACQYIASLPGFRLAPQTSLIGPHVYGTLENEGITVIRSNTIVAPNEVIAAFSSDNSPFEAPVVCATYMPVFLTDTMPVADNPFQSQRAIASWKAIEPVVAEFVQRIVITKDADPAADVNVFLTTTPTGGSGSGSNGGSNG